MSPLMPGEKNKAIDIIIIAGIVAVALIIMFIMARFEMVRRAGREYNEGEKFMSFYKNPDLKKQYYDEKHNHIINFFGGDINKFNNFFKISFLKIFD